MRKRTLNLDGGDCEDVAEADKESELRIVIYIGLKTCIEIGKETCRKRSESKRHNSSQ